MSDLNLSSTMLLVENPDPAKMQKVISFGRVKQFLVPHNHIKSCTNLPVIPLFRRGARLSDDLLRKFSSFSTLAIDALDSGDLKGILPSRDFRVILRASLNRRNWSSFVEEIKRTAPDVIQLESEKGSSLELIEKAYLELQKSNLAGRVRNTTFNLANAEFSDWIELEDFSSPPEFEAALNSQLKFSIIIPHFGSAQFLIATLWNLSATFQTRQDFEVIVVDDGSQEQDFDYLLRTCRTYFSKRLNLRVYRWPRTLTFESGRKVFRAGHSRNWGAFVSQASNLLFLDSDMLTPLDLTRLTEKALDQSDFCQFVRYHVPNDLSRECSRYEELVSKKSLFIEEGNYWAPFFKCSQWGLLDDPWRYVCSYAFGIRRELFHEIGGFRRDFLSYGFEDTDLGFRLFESNRRPSLIKEPLLHLSRQSVDRMPFLKGFKRARLLRPMARVFYQINRPPNILKKWTSLLA